jgi:hypothetical protein
MRHRETKEEDGARVTMSGSVKNYPRLAGVFGEKRGDVLRVYDETPKHE